MKSKHKIFVNIIRPLGIITLVAVIGLAVISCDDIKDNNTTTPTIIDITAIQGVTAPVTGAAPVSSITQTTQYSGTVTWNGSPAAFAASTVYTATITLKAKEGFTLEGVAANFFKVAGATTANAANSGTITAKFPTTGAPVNPESFKDITAVQLVDNIKIGWNLGNALDAYNLTWLPANPTVTQMETGWVSHVTTKANITAIKNAGFNAIRIPVSWTKAAGPAPNYTIRADWMARVTAIVNYAVDNDMYILLNTHHDENVFKFTNAQKTASIAAFRKIWEQIADNFRNYNEKLIFEGLNEPRTIGSANEWNGGSTEERANLNEHYQVFVDTVRNSGGNNNKRILQINTYAASATTTAVNGLTLPTDTASNKLIVSIHAYTPGDFAFPENKTATSWSSSNSSHTGAIHSAIQPAYDKFVSKGVPVIMGEFGAADKSNPAARAAWAEYYVTYAKSKGVKCFYWDDFGSFKIFNRSNNTFYSQAVLDALINGAGSTGSGSTDSGSNDLTPNSITGNMGNYRFGLDGGTTNYTQAVWDITDGNLTTIKTAGAKLVLVLSAAPAAGMQLVWQGPSNDIWWEEASILGDTGNSKLSGVTWNSGAKTLTINLSTVLVNYNSFTTQPSIRLIIAYYGGDSVNSLGIVSANLTP